MGRRYGGEIAPQNFDADSQAILPWIKASLWFTAFLSILLIPLFQRRVEPLWDARDFFYPAFTYAADSIAERRFPLWDPFTNCGLPFHADPQSPTLSPIALFFGYLFPDTSLGFIAFWTFHWWWGGVGMLWLARHFGGSPLGGLFAAITYALSGFFIGHAEHTSYLIVAAWLPWIFWFADKALLTSNHGWSILAGSALGTASLGGYPGLVAFTGFAVSLWLILRHLPAGSIAERIMPSLKTRAAHVVATICIIALVSITIWSPVLHAFFTEGGAYTDRVAGLAPEASNDSSPFVLKALFSILFPYVTIAGNLWMHVSISMTNAYMGILTIPFAILWWWKERKKQRLWGLLIFLIFMFLLSLGGKAGVRTILYYLYPPLQFMRYSAPFRLYWIMPITLLGGLGFSSLRRCSGEKNLIRTIFAVWFAVTAFGSIFLILLLSYQDMLFIARSVRLFLPALLILPAALTVLWLGTTDKNMFTRTNMLSLLLLCILSVDMAGHLYNNALTVWSVGDSTLQAERLHRRSTVINGEPGPRAVLSKSGYFNSQQITKSPVVQGYAPMRSHGFDDVLCKNRFVEVLQSPIRFWISPGVEQIHDEEAAISEMASTGSGVPAPAFIGTANGLLSAKRTVPGAFGKVKVVAYSAETVELEVEVPAGPGGFLLSTERFAPGWKAWIDGVSQPIIKTNLFFRGMFVSAGHHAIVWRYEPAWWKVLVVVSFTTLAASAAFGIALVRYKIWPKDGIGEPDR